jgi:hypothetical protein
MTNQLSWLADHRSAFNRRFDEAASQYSALTAEAGYRFFREDLAPLMEAVDLELTSAERQAGRLFEIADVATVVGLRATGQRSLGPTALQPHVEALWRTVLPVLARSIIADPTLIGALTSAATQIARVETARPQQWLTLVARAGAHAQDAAEVRRIGQVAAWRSGLAQYRETALAVLDDLSAQRVIQVLDLGPEPPAVEVVRSSLSTNRWWNGAPSAQKWSTLQQGGSFTGFGGRFISPPRLKRRREELFAAVGNEVFLVCADGFGVTFHREPPLGAADTFEPEPGATVGLVTQAVTNNASVRTSGPVTSAVVVEGALALTTLHSHRIVFLSLGGSADGR